MTVEQATGESPASGSTAPPPSGALADADTAPGKRSVAELEGRSLPTLATAAGSGAGAALAAEGAPAVSIAAGSGTAPVSETTSGTRSGSASAAGTATSGGGSGAATAAAVIEDSAEGDDDPWLGKVIDGRYKVLSLLGQGGMGSVYRVEHLHMGKIAAMKVLHRELAAEKEVVKRFRREAAAVSRLTHVNTVQTFDFGSFDGALYLVMEYVRGEDLGAIVRRDGPLPYSRVAPIFAQICGALAEAHDSGIVHRDLKPENVLVTRSKEGRDFVKVVDFGLAKVREREELNEVTGRGNLIGTPYYMSPEQIRSEGIDGRSDVYSLGAMLYRVLTGEPPFAGATPIGVITKHLTDELVPPSERKPELDIDPRVDAIVMRAMAKKPEERYATAEEMKGELEAVAVELGDAELALATSGELPQRRSSDRLGRLPPAHGQSGPLRTPQAYEITAPHLKDTPELSSSAKLRHPINDESSADPRQRLRREDLDEYERSLKWRARVRTMIVPVIVLAMAVGAGLLLRWWRLRPRSAEQEPNNDLAHANRIGRGKAMLGYLKGRLSDRLGDADFYLIPSGGDRRVLSLVLDPIPNMDLELDVYDADGKTLARADATAVGGPERITNLGIDGREAYVLVREVPMKDRWPTENTSDQYRLLADWRPARAGEEIEPSEPHTPISVRVGGQVQGFLGQPNDVDVFRIEGGEGQQVTVRVDALSGVDLVLRIEGAAAPVVADKGPASEGEEATFTWKTGDPAPTVLVQRKDPPGTPAERETRIGRISGLELPYLLLVSAKP